MNEFNEYYSDDDDLIVIKEIDEYKYEKLYYKIKDYIHDYYLELEILANVDYIYFYQYIMNTLNKDCSWIKSKKIYIGEQRYMFDVRWFNKYDEELLQIKKLIDAELKRNIDIDNYLDFMYTYSGKYIAKY